MKLLPAIATAFLSEAGTARALAIACGGWEAWIHRLVFGSGNEIGRFTTGSMWVSVVMLGCDGGFGWLAGASLGSFCVAAGPGPGSVPMATGSGFRSGETGAAGAKSFRYCLRFRSVLRN